MNKVLLISKPMESKWLVVSNLPETATEETIKECFERHGRIQSVKIDHRRYAFIAFLDIRTALKAHHAENILDEQQLRTAFYDGSNSISEVLLETSPVTSLIDKPSPSSPSSISTVTNTLMDKTISAVYEDRDKRTSRTPYSPEENTRHQVVPMKHDSDSSESKRKTSPINNSKLKMKSLRRKHNNSSSSSSERSHDDSLSHKYRRQHPSKLKRQSSNLNYSKTKILKIYHLPSTISTQSLRETLRNIFMDFKKPSHLLTIKIINDYALLTFEKSEDVDKALLFIITKSINGIRLKAEPYDDLLIENDDYDLMKRSIGSDLDIDEYSVKATRTLYIGNLQPEISYHELRKIYSVYGEIIEIEIKRQHSQIFAFIQYADIKSVVNVLKSKVIHDHSIKLGFGKGQPTNVLWLDDLPSNITESMLRLFLNRITNLSSNEILDIYIDNRNSEKSQIVQCLIYFTDIIAAQNAMNSIRGKKFETKRIQVDFASRIFLTRFSDIIQQTNQKNNNNRWTNRSDRRYSKVSDTGSSVSQNLTRHHSSSSSNHQKLIKSDTDKHANTSRIFDWIMQNHHLNGNDDEEGNSEDQISNIKLIENKKNSNEISIGSKKIIPLESNSSLIQSDIRLKFYSSLSNQKIKSIHLPLPQFAKNLTKLSNNSIILNPKAHLKHLLNNNQDLLIHKELNEKIKLSDKQIDQNIQISSSVSTNSSVTIHPTPMPSISSLHPPISSSLISPPSSNQNLSNILSIKFKRKPIPPPLSVMPTPSNPIENSNHSPALTFSSISQKQPVNNSPKPTILKSILKQQSTSNEIRKAVHIISTNPSLKSIGKQTLPSNDKNKPTNNHQIEPKKSLKIAQKPPHATEVVQTLSKIPKTNLTPHTEINKKSSSLKPIQQNKNLLLNKPSVSNIKKSEQKFNHHKKFKLKQNTCMYDRIKERSRTEQIRNRYLLSKKNKNNDDDTQPIKRHEIIDSSKAEDNKTIKTKNTIIFDSEIFDTEENDNKKINQQQKIRSKFNMKQFILKKKSRTQKRPLIDESNRSSKKIKLQSIINEEQIIKSELSSDNIFIENTLSLKVDTTSPKTSKNDDEQSVLMNSEEERTLKKDETIELANSFSTIDEPPEKTFDIANHTNSSNTPIDHQTVITDKSIPTISSDITEPSCVPLSKTDETLNLFNSQPIVTHKHPSTSMHFFPQTLTPDNNLFTLHHQNFSYPFFAPPPPDSPPLSTSSCSSIIGNSFYNTIISGQQHCHDKESRRDSFTKLSTTSSQYLGSDSIASFRNPSELYGYPTTAQQMLNSFATELYRMTDIQSSDPYDIQWEGYIILKSDQAYIKTQLIAGNSQIARITINYWNSDLNDNLHISQRMRLEEIQLDGVKKHMQMTNDHCILIAEPNGLTPDEIRLEQNHLKNGVIQYLNEKKAAGILNILLPGVLQPIYVVHIFPPCQFASEILQERAPDAYRCVVQNKIEQIYLLFIITSTIQ